MSGNERLVEPIGAIDGINRLFRTPTNYQPGTLRVFRNILIRSADDNGFDEIPPDKFEMKVPPLEGDMLYVRYIEA